MKRNGENGTRMSSRIKRRKNCPARFAVEYPGLYPSRDGRRSDRASWFSRKSRTNCAWQSSLFQIGHTRKRLTICPLSSAIFSKRKRFSVTRESYSNFISEKECVCVVYVCIALYIDIISEILLAFHVFASTLLKLETVLFFFFF